jgi:hypothetical protein
MTGIPLNNESDTSSPIAVTIPTRNPRALAIREEYVTVPPRLELPGRISLVI